MSEVALELSHLATGYGDLHVVWDVSLTARYGEVTALLGRNGTGKTTTLRAIAGINKINRGELKLGGQDISTVPAHKRAGLGVAFVQEGKRVFHQRTVRENIVLGTYPTKANRKEVHEQTELACERFPALRDRLDQPAGALSGGQQQMLAIAQALASKPKVLLLDEPSAGLSPALVAVVLESIVTLRDEGLAIILVEQSVDFALEVAESVVVIDLGRMTFTGDSTTPELRNRVERAYFGDQPALAE